MPRPGYPYDNKKLPTYNHMILQNSCLNLFYGSWSLPHFSGNPLNHKDRSLSRASYESPAAYLAG